MSEQAIGLPPRGAIEIETPSADAESTAVAGGSRLAPSAARCATCGQILEAPPSGGSLIPHDPAALQRDSIGAAAESDHDGGATIHPTTSPGEHEVRSDIRSDLAGTSAVWWNPSVTGENVFAILELLVISEQLRYRVAHLIVESEVVGPGVPQQGDVFYVRLSIGQVAAIALADFNAFVYFDLPDGLVLAADDARPLRTFRQDPPPQSGDPRPPEVEYPGASYVEQQGRRLTLMSRAGAAAPQFRMWQGVRYGWWIPVTATAPLPMRPLRVTLDATSSNSPHTQVALDFPIFAGDPRSQVWQYYQNQSGLSMYNSYQKLGVPTDAESPVPWSHPRVPSTPVGTMQTFRRPLPGDRWEPFTLTWSPLYGIHKIVGDHRRVWLQYADRLGPAREDTSIRRQEFAGGYTYYDQFNEVVRLGGIYCWDHPNWC